MSLTRTIFLALACSALAVAQDPVPMPKQETAKPPTREEAKALLDAGNYKDAEQAFSARRSADPKDGEATLLLGYALQMSGKLQQAHDLHLEATAFPEHAALAHYHHACVHALWSQLDPAFQALDVAMANGFHDVVRLEADHAMTNLRSDARYAALLEKLRPAPPRSASGVAEPHQLAQLPNALRMDFFQDSWEVRDANDQPVSNAHAAKIFDGTALRATITDKATGKARTEATYFPHGDGWRMFWINSSGERAVLEGALVEDQMIFGLVTMNGAPQNDSRAVFSNITSQYFTYTWETKGPDGEWKALDTWRYLRASGGK